MLSEPLLGLGSVLSTGNMTNEILALEVFTDTPKLDG